MLCKYSSHEESGCCSKSDTFISERYLLHDLMTSTAASSSQTGGHEGGSTQQALHGLLKGEK